MAHLAIKLTFLLAFAQHEFKLLIKNELAGSVAADLGYLPTKAVPDYSD